MGALGRCVLHEISPISIKLGQFEGLPMQNSSNRLSNDDGSHDDVKEERFKLKTFACSCNVEFNNSAAKIKSLTWNF